MTVGGIAPDDAGLRAAHAGVRLPAASRACGLLVTDADLAVVTLREKVAESPSAGATVHRQAEFLAGRYCAASALAALGCAEGVRRGDDRAPAWPAGYVGSLTHSHGRVLAVAAPRGALRSIGVDVERVVDDVTAVRVGPRIIDDDERAALAADGAFDDPLAFTLAFSAKESLYKCLYPIARRYMGYRTARVVEARRTSATTGALTLELATAWAPSLPAGRRFEAAFALVDAAVQSAVWIDATADDESASRGRASAT